VKTRFTEDALEVHAREELAQLDTGTLNQGNGRAELQAHNVLEQLKMTNNHAKLNIVPHREIIISERMNSASQSAVKSQSQKDDGSSKNISAVKMKASILAEQSSAIVAMAADFKTTLEWRKPYVEAKMLRIKLANLQQLRELGIIDEEEFKAEARKLI
jgi:hypothetical protein